MNETETPALLANAKPRPWRAPIVADIDERYCEWTEIPLTDDPDGPTLALAGDVEDDALLIVRAVNEYEALLDLERLVRRHHGREVSGESSYYADCEECRALVRLDEARAVSRGDA